MPVSINPTIYLPPLMPDPDNREEFETDLQILQDDRLALDALVGAIIANKRLAWHIVEAWINEHGYLLVPKESTP